LSSGAPAYPNLFSPLTLAGQDLRNRICLPATLTNYAQGNRITPRWGDFLVERARGGAAMLVTEVIAVDPNAIAQAAVVTGFDDANDDGFRQTADAVHDAGARLVGQLWHPGRQQLWHPTQSPRAVSDAPDAYSWTVGHVMSEDEIAAVRDAYVAVAGRLQRCGFAGVELHGAHGYLITQFLSPWSNGRDDAYGGDRAGRCRFALEVANGIRQRCGGDFIIGLKMPGDEGVAGGIDVDEADALTRHLVVPKVFDYIAYGQGNFSLSLETHVPDLYFQPGHFIDIHKRMRAAADGTPVMALGRIGTPDLAERVIADGYGDLVGMSRAQIADAAFANKARDGRADDIRPTVFDNFCWGEIHQGKPLAEFHNPHLAETGEHNWSPAPASRGKKVVVVGGGPAGLEAAWVAAARGHRVTLIGASEAVGGKLRLEADLPGRADMRRVVDHQERLCHRHGVDLKLGMEATAADVWALSPDAVVLASGADLRQPDGVGAGTQLMISARDYVAEGVETGNQDTVVLFDHDHGPATYAVADLLAERFAHLIVITPRTDIAQNVNYCSAIGVYRRLYRAGCAIVTAHQPVDFDGRVLTCINVFTGEERSFPHIDLVVYATPRRANDALAAELDGIELHLAGDCMSPRHLMAAIHEGHAVGLRV